MNNNMIYVGGGLNNVLSHPTLLGNYAIWAMCLQCKCSLCSSFLVILRTSKLSVPESFELLKSHRLLKSCNGPHM